MSITWKGAPFPYVSLHNGEIFQRRHKGKLCELVFGQHDIGSPSRWCIIIEGELLAVEETFSIAYDVMEKFLWYCEDENRPCEMIDDSESIRQPPNRSTILYRPSPNPVGWLKI